MGNKDVCFVVVLFAFTCDTLLCVSRSGRVNEKNRVCSFEFLRRFFRLDLAVVVVSLSLSFLIDLHIALHLHLTLNDRILKTKPGKQDIRKEHLPLTYVLCQVLLETVFPYDVLWEKSSKTMVLKDNSKTTVLRGNTLNRSSWKGCLEERVLSLFEATRVLRVSCSIKERQLLANVDFYWESHALREMCSRFFMAKEEGDSRRVSLTYFSCSFSWDFFFTLIYVLSQGILILDSACHLSLGTLFFLCKMNSIVRWYAFTREDVYAILLVKCSSFHNIQLHVSTLISCLSLSLSHVSRTAKCTAKNFLWRCSKYTIRKWKCLWVKWLRLCPSCSS